MDDSSLPWIAILPRHIRDSRDKERSFRARLMACGFLEKIWCNNYQSCRVAL